MDTKKIFIILLIIILISIYNYIQISKFKITSPNISSPKLSQDLRITQITDYHANRLIDTEDLIDEVKKFNPHIIVLTGDIIDSKTNNMETTINLVEKLYNINKNIYFVIGNHELRNVNGDIFISRLKEIGVTVLDNENTVVKVGKDNINIIGLSFYSHKEDYNKSIEEIGNSNFTMLLSHSPNRPLSFSSGVEDLILSGHTHGGQVRFPLIGSIIAPGQGLFPEYDKGIFNLGDTTLYIDSGLGNSMLPIRLFNRVQISNITVKAVESN